MDAIMGVLLDVSGSMRNRNNDLPTSVIGPVEPWAHSIFKVVNGLIKNDYSDNKIFAICFGAQKSPYTFDLLSTIHPFLQSKEENFERIVHILKANNVRSIVDFKDIKHFDDYINTKNTAVLLHLLRKNIEEDIYPILSSKEEHIEMVIQILKENGAPYIDEWVDNETLTKYIDSINAALFVHFLTNYPDFRSEFVKECIPDACKTRISIASTATATAGCCVKCFKCFNNKVEDSWDETKREAIKQAMNKGLEMSGNLEIHWDDIACVVQQSSVFTVEQVRQLLDRNIEVDELTNENIATLMESINPYIYGPTPLVKALSQAHKLFTEKAFQGLHKAMFVLSDGRPTDGTIDERTYILRKFKLSDIKVVGCYVTDNAILTPKRLYCSNMQQSIDDNGAEYLFDISSTIPTEMLPRTIFLKRDWIVDNATNETKLFFYINQPELIKDVCSFARDTVCSRDALSDVLTTVSLGLYINKANKMFKAHKQKGGTCYANASAAVLHLAMHRIFCREDGYPTFRELRTEMVEEYGIEGANTWDVIKVMCNRYRLQCKEVDACGALNAIVEKRPILAKFRLPECVWPKFKTFFNERPRAILTSMDIAKCTPERQCCSEQSGHAVVLSSYNREGFRLMNSWGTKWGDSGFFRVKNENVLGLEFMDVFWESSDLTPFEKEMFRQDGSFKAQELLQQLVGLSKATFQCPLCSRESRVQDFIGRLVVAICPVCGGKFSTKNNDDLVLNLYLLSLSNEE